MKLAEFKNNIFLAIVCYLTTIGTELIYFSLSGRNILIPPSKLIILFLFFLLATFVSGPKKKFFFCNFILLLSFFQMLHYEFYGMPIYPTAIYLLFTQMSEITGTIKEDTFIFYTPLLLFIPAITLNVWSQKKLVTKSRPIFFWIFVFYLFYNPLRTFITDNTWGRQPSTQELMGSNLYLSSSYFAGKILPAKIGENRAYKENPIKFSKVKPFDGNIIFVLGESLSPSHMSLFGYKRETTPFLNNFKEDNRFIYRRGVSGGISTDIAVAFLINNTFGFYGNGDILKGQTCLFRMAKESNFKTYFYSTQSQQQLRYITNNICPDSIDDYKNLDAISPNHHDPNAASDFLVLSEFKKLDLKENSFVILHQRGSHPPYNLRYKNIIYPISADKSQSRLDHYDNSIREFDLFMDELITHIDKSNKNTLLIYSSDHGQRLGEGGIWGHAKLSREAVDIPVFAYSKNALSLPKLSINPTHLEVSLTLSQLLGFKHNLTEVPPKDYVIFGNDIDGFAGHLKTNFSDGQLIKLEK